MTYVVPGVVTYEQALDAPPLVEGQYAFHDLIMGMGTPYLVTHAELFNWPEVYSNDFSRNEVNGISTQPWDFYGGRTMAIDVLVQGDYTNPLALRERIHALSAACVQRYQGELVPFRFWQAGQPDIRRLLGRVRGFVVQDDTIGFGYVLVNIRFQAMTPTIMSEALSESVVSFPGTGPVGTSGRQYVRVYQFTDPDEGTTVNDGWRYMGPGEVLEPANQAFCTNAGNFPVAPVITLVGPVTNPVLTHLESGAVVAFAVTLTPSDVFVIDMGEGIVLLNGVNRYNALVPGSRFFTLLPGQNRIRYNGTFSAGAVDMTSMTVQWRTPWM